jgi:hypothetical protein
MREIRFRAWDGKKFGYVSIGCDRITWPSPDFFEQKFSGMREGSPEQVRFANVESFQQFTGLHDKEGEPIYEGDVVRMLYTDWPSNPAPDNKGLDEYKKSISKNGTVVWERDRWMLNFGPSRYGDDELGRMAPGAHGECAVIGNIYENPELLSTTMTPKK